MEDNASRLNRARQRSGFSLIEILLVLALMTIVAGIILPRLESDSVDQLERAAQILASDLAYARNLAVVNNSTYRVRFIAIENQYILEHSGSNSALNDLPTSQFDNALDQPTKLVTDFDVLPHIGRPVRISIVRQKNISGNDPLVVASTVTEVEFGPLGGTIASENTIVWLSNGAGGSFRHIPVQIDPVTGLATVGKVHSVPEYSNDDSIEENTSPSGSYTSDPYSTDSGMEMYNDAHNTTTP